MASGSNTDGSGIGTFLRQWRKARRLSMEQVAERAGVSRVTLNRWEMGQFQPRLPELQAVLSALDAGPGERARALTLVDAPRAVAQLRRDSSDAARQTAASGNGSAAVVGSAPCAGDLLRALRLRRRLPLEAVAAGLGVQARTVRRWEASESAVPSGDERLDALCALLGVQPPERAALTQGLLLLGAAETQTGGTHDACAAEVAALAAQTERGEYHLMDLRFLLLEARLYPRATADSSARRLLAETYTWHAQWLSHRGRIREAGPLAHRALDMATARRPRFPDPFWLPAVHVSAVYDRDVRRAPPAHQIEFYRHWLPPLAGRPKDESRLWRDMANAASVDGYQMDTALAFIHKAIEAAQRSEDETTMVLARSVHANVLERAGRPGDALRSLASVPAFPFTHSYDLAVRWARLLLATGDRNGAREWLARAYQIANDYDLLPGTADQLAQRF